jgi:DNA-binding transcriptional LysR family regulator
MDVKDLRYFVAVYETKGFSSASLILGTVQSNVSARIGSLEEFLGVPLFKRGYRKIVPTERGDAFYPHAKQLLASFDRAARLIKAEGAA